MTEKLFVGAKVRRLRETRQWTLEACASRLALSPSYLSQIETNQRPVTARVLIALTQAFQVDAGIFDASEEGRLAADLREATLESATFANPPTAAEVKQAAKLTPGLAQQFLALHSAFRRLNDRVKAMDEAISLDEGARASASLPYEEVREFFHHKDNYFDDLDLAAEALGSALGMPSSSALGVVLEAALAARMGISVSRVRGGDHGLLRRYDQRSRSLQVNGAQPTPSQDFQLGYQLAAMEFADLIETELERANFRTMAARDICRVGLINYTAGALLMPYTRFAEAAVEMRHDIEQMCALFQTSFEQTCHRLSTLQRRGHRGLPFYFVRVDLAGNITKRHSATRFQFARFGGACPLWNVHDAFSRPGDILVQVAEMPDGQRYLCMARSELKPSGSHAAPGRRYALGLGCEIQHAPSVIYSAGIELEGPAALIGINCRICERTSCPQRAFPPLEAALQVLPDVRKVVPYSIEA